MTVTRLAHLILMIVVPLCITSAATVPVNAQTVRGQLRATEPDRPLPGARLLLLREDGERVDSTVTDRAGRFSMTAPDAGTFYLYFRSDGWASVTSNVVRLERHATTDFLFRMPLVANAALRQMGDVIRNNMDLQASLPEICGGELEPERTGMLVGVVRNRRSRAPVGRARVAIGTVGDDTYRSTLSTDTGVYVLCNVPAGSAIPVRAEAPDGSLDQGTVVIRAGMISWYDLRVASSGR